MASIISDDNTIDVTSMLDVSVISSNVIGKISDTTKWEVSSSSQQLHPLKRHTSAPPDSGLLPPCRVCDLPASGFHYGANTCEACKAFFRRGLALSERYKCAEGGHCHFGNGFKARTWCTYCRYQKCLAVGMSREGIKTGRYTHAKRAKYITELNQMKESSLVKHDMLELRSQCTEPAQTESMRLMLSHSNNYPSLDALDTGMHSESRDVKMMSDYSNNIVDIQRQPPICDKFDYVPFVSSYNGESNVSDRSWKQAKPSFTRAVEFTREQAEEHESLSTVETTREDVEEDDYLETVEITRNRGERNFVGTVGSTREQIGEHDVFSSNGIMCEQGERKENAMSLELLELSANKLDNAMSLETLELSTDSHGQPGKYNSTRTVGIIREQTGELNSIRTLGITREQVEEYDFFGTVEIIRELSYECASLPDTIIKGYKECNPFWKYFANEYTLRKRQRKYYEERRNKNRLFGSLRFLTKTEYYDFYDKTGIDIDGRRHHMSERISDIERLLKQRIRFLTELRIFQCIPKEDMISLLVVNSMETNILAGYKTLDLDLEVGVYPNGELFTMDQFPRWMYDYIKKSNGVVRGFARLELTIEELALLDMVCFLSADRAHVKEPEKIEDLQLMFISCLRQELRRTRSNPDQTFYHIWDRLIALRDVSSSDDNKNCLIKSMEEFPEYKQSRILTALIQLTLIHLTSLNGLLQSETDVDFYVDNVAAISQAIAE